MLFLTGNPHLILACLLSTHTGHQALAPKPCTYPCLAPNQAPNLTLTEIEIQSQKPAPTIPSVCLFIYTYTRTTLSLLVYLAPHSTTPAPYPCLAPYTKPNLCLFV
jgi:hypothetical protein